MSETCKPLRHLTLVKTEWTLKIFIPRTLWQSQETNKEKAYIYFYNEKKPQCLETDASGLSLGTGLLQVREGITCSRAI